MKIQLGEPEDFKISESVAGGRITTFSKDGKNYALATSDLTYRDIVSLAGEIYKTTKPFSDS